MTQKPKRGAPIKSEEDKASEVYLMRMKGDLKKRFFDKIPKGKRAAFLHLSLEFMLDVIEGRRTLDANPHDIEEYKVS